MESARHALEARLAALRPEDKTLSAILELGRELHEQGGTYTEPAEVSVQFETYGRRGSHIDADLTFRWLDPETFEAAPERLHLRFDLPPGPRTREVMVRSREYPHIAAFVTAAIEAAELEASAPASDLRIELESP